MNGIVNRNPAIDSLVSQLKAGRQVNPADYKQAKTETQKTNIIENFDKFFEERIGGLADQKENKELLTALKKYAASKIAPAEISFVESNNNTKTSRLTPASQDKNLQFEGDISIHEENDNKDSKIEGQIKSGSVKVNFNNKEIIDMMKKADSNILDFKYTDNGGKGSYSMNYDSPGPNTAINLKTDDSGKLYLENSGFYSMIGVADSRVTYAVQKQLDGFGIKTKTENKDGKIYFVPTNIGIENLPLSADGHSKGDVHIAPKDAKFAITKTGLEIKFENADIKGLQKSNDNPNLTGSSKENFQGKVNYQANFDLKNGGVKDQQADIKIDHADAEISLRNPQEIKGFIKSLQQQFNADQKTADTLISGLKKAGLAPELIDSMISADDKKINEIANNPDLSDKLKQASIKLDLKNLNVKVDNNGLKVNGENTEISAKAKLDTGHNINFNSTVSSLNADITNQTLNTGAIKLDGNIKADNGDTTKLSADTTSVNASGMKDVKIGNSKANINVESNGKKANLEAQANSINANLSDNTQQIKADSIKTKINASENGIEFANISAQAKEINAKLGANSTTIDTKALNVNGTAKDIKLSKEQIETVTNLIQQTKDKVAEKLKNIGLTEKQFIGIANAITNISKQKGSIENQISAVAKNSGATKQQMKDIIALVSNQEFKSMLTDVDKISESIKAAKDGKFNLNVNAGANNFSVTQQNNQLLTSAKQVGLKVSAFSSDGKVNGNTNIKVDTVNTESTKDRNKVSTGKIVGDGAVSAGQNNINLNAEIDDLKLSEGDDHTYVKIGNSKEKLTASSGLNVEATGNGTTFSDSKKEEGKLSLERHEIDVKYRNNEAHASADKIEVNPNGASMDKLSVEAKTFRQQGQSSLRANATFNSDKISVNKGEVSVKNNNGRINADFKSPVLNVNDFSTNFSSDSINVKPDGTTNIPGLAFDKINGNTKISYGRLKKLIENNPSGKSMLNTIASKGINIPENQVLDFKLDKGAMKNGKFSGNISLPSFDADLGKAKISMKVASTDSSGNSAKLSGNIELKIDPDKFTKLLYQELGIDKKEIQLKTIDGQVKAKIDGFFKSADVTVSLENDQLKINVDKAKFMKIIGVSGIAKDTINDMLKQSNLHSVDNGKTLSVPLKEITDKFIDVKGLDISNVTNNGNTFNIPFSYKN